MEIIEMEVKALRPYAHNPRDNDKAVEYVANSIRQFGFKVPIVIDRNWEIICGHTRWKAAKVLGLETVPCVMADDLTPEQVKAFRLADNKTAEMADWNWELLAAELEDIDPAMFDMADFGFFQDPEPEPEKEVAEDDFDPAEVKELRCASGEIWKLGNHRLMIGDATDPLQVQSLTDGAEMDLYLTDPPYGIEYTGGPRPSKTRALDPLENDTLSGDGLEQFLTSAFTAAHSTMRRGAAYYCWYAIWNHTTVETALKSAGFHVKQQLVWVKDRLALGRQDYQWRHEPCLYGWKDGPHYFTPDRTKTTVIDDTRDLSKLTKEELRAILEDILKDEYTTVIHEKKPLTSDIHPTMKPLKLLEHQVKNSSRPGDKVLDTFGGSGSTLMVCEQLNRTCYMMELDPKYGTAIIERWEKFTGQTAECIEPAPDQAE